MRSGLALLMALELAGCSWVFVDAAPAGHERMPFFTCTQSRAPAVLDTLFMAVNGLTAFAWMTVSPNDVPERGAYALLDGAAAALFLASAVSGFRDTRVCRGALEELGARTAGGCTKDADCKGDRVCSPSGMCVAP